MLEENAIIESIKRGNVLILNTSFIELCNVNLAELREVLLNSKVSVIIETPLSDSKHRSVLIECIKSAFSGTKLASIDFKGDRTNLGEVFFDVIESCDRFSFTMVVNFSLNCLIKLKKFKNAQIDLTLADPCNISVLFQFLEFHDVKLSHLNLTMQTKRAKFCDFDVGVKIEEMRIILPISSDVSIIHILSNLDKVIGLKHVELIFQFPINKNWMEDVMNLLRNTNYSETLELHILYNHPKNIFDYCANTGKIKSLILETEWTFGPNIWAAIAKGSPYLKSFSHNHIFSCMDEALLVSKHIETVKLRHIVITTNVNGEESLILFKALRASKHLISIEVPNSLTLSVDLLDENEKRAKSFALSRDLALVLIATRRFRSSALNRMPKEIVKMIAVLLTETWLDECWK